MESMEPRHGSRPIWATLGLLILLVPLLVGGGYLAPSPMAILVPAAVVSLDSLVRIEGTTYQAQGHLYITAVRPLNEPRLGQYLLARLQPDVEYLNKASLHPEGLSAEEHLAISQRLLQESCTIAKVVALGEARRAVKFPEAHVEVIRILPGSPAAGILQRGDIIESVDGERIHAVAELVSLIQARLQGEVVSLRVRRDHRYEPIDLPVLHGPVDADGPVLGIVALTVGLDFNSPVEIAVDPGPITGGTSGGLMYALGIYNALVTEDITRGHRVAGTGSLRANGRVGPVTGIRLKVRAAEDAGAEYFLVPAENEVAARTAAESIKIIPVGSFREALAALRQLDNDPSGNQRTVPASQDTTLAWLPVR